jgi:site-specific DNA recombinase
MKYFIYCRKSSEAEDRQILSLESQLSTLRQSFGANPDIEIVATYQEAYSAKAPGRVQFEEMLERIEAKEAEGIVTWAPDRLARNSIDGGRIVYLLDRGILKDLKFATSSFENTSQGKFMLQIMFGQSKYYSDALSDNVKRGNRTKVARGWRPNRAPLGYRHNPTDKTVVPDAVEFPLIRRMFDLILTGGATPRQVAITARDEWGFRTRLRKRSGGKPLAMSTIYHMLQNPFYAGVIVWGGESFPGKHTPVVSISEFERVQAALKPAAQPRPQRYAFPFTGLIRCGNCGLSVTAEHKFNRSKRHYIYYHCTRPRLGRCPEPCIEARELERQIEAFLRTLSVPAPLHRWALKQLRAGAGKRREYEQARLASLRVARDQVANQLHELTALRLRQLLSDGEFVEERERLRRELLRLDQEVARPEPDPLPNLEALEDLISFGNSAAKWFAAGDDETKRLIVRTACSNLSLNAKKLSIQAAKPFLTTRGVQVPCPSENTMFEPPQNGSVEGRNGASEPSRPSQLGELEDVRTTQDGTIPCGGPEFVKEVRRLFAERSKEFLERLACLHELNARFRSAYDRAA